MLIRTPREIGALIRDHRKQQKLDQADLAQRIGVNRRWVVEVERGKPRAEVGLILKALQALGLTVAIDSAGKPAETQPDGLDSIDIDAIVRNAKRPLP